MTVRISCVVPAYNSRFFLARCLASLLMQDREPDEIIVSDDSSDPSVGDMVRDWSALYPTIRYVPGPQSGNAVDNWNRGIDEATGDYVILVHHDEWCASKDYFRQVETLILDQSSPVSVFVGSTVVGALRKSRHALVQKWAIRAGLPKWTLYASNWIGPSAALVFPRDRGERFDPVLKSMVDVDFYARVSEGRELLWLKGTHVYSGSHVDQITAQTDLHSLNMSELSYLKSRTISASAGQIRIIETVLRLRRYLSRFRQISPRRK